MACENSLIDFSQNFNNVTSHESMTVKFIIYLSKFELNFKQEYQLTEKDSYRYLFDSSELDKSFLLICKLIRSKK